MKRYGVTVVDHAGAYPPWEYCGAGDTPEGAFADAMNARRKCKVAEMAQDVPGGGGEGAEDAVEDDGE